MATLLGVGDEDEHFEVVGDVLGEAETEGDVVGTLMGIEGDLEGGDEVVGVVTRRGRMHRIKRHKGGASIALKKPGWRKSLGPGVPHPGEGMVVLPTTPQQNGGTFTATIPSITWQGTLQKPFRSERMLTSSVRTGTSAVGRLLGQIFVGTDLQGADITGFDIELVGAANAFGTRLTLIEAPPGVLVRIPVVLSQGLTGTDTIFASIQFIGRWVH